MKRYGLNYETYKKITEKCVICGFDKFVALHHLDQDKSNNSGQNLIGLCPNHHQMLHTQKYREEIFQALREKRLNPQEKKPREGIKGSY
jgi:predicted HNH restriction endonuclease